MLRSETFAWLKQQELACFAFNAGMPGRGSNSLVIAPANAGFLHEGASGGGKSEMLELPHRQEDGTLLMAACRSGQPDPPAIPRE